MPSGRNGWADIIGDTTDEVPRTDPDGAPLDFTAEPTIDQRPPPASIDTDDPVLAAMAELDGPASIPQEALVESDPTARAPVPEDRAGTPRLPLPSAPTDSPSRGFDAADTADGFELDQARLREAFEAEPTQMDAGASFWRTYRWVILAAAVGMAAFAGAVAYSTTRSDEPVYVKPQLTPVPVTPPVPAKLVEPVAKPEPKIVKKEAEVASVPMLTVLSKPTGGLVEVNGEILGKAPVIRPAPTNAKLLEVVVKLDGYRRFVKQIAPSDAGHFTLTADLEKK